MKKRLIILTLFPFFTVTTFAADMVTALNMRGLPEDFRRYFYDSELIVQVYLNDKPLFDAAVAMKENGSVRLIRTVEDAQDADPEKKAFWAGVLQEGVTVGKCTKNCPSGLMAVQYQLDNSSLRLYTANYETSRVKNAYISLPEDAPGGVIMTNLASFTSTAFSRSWGITSSLLSSLAGWSQKASFQFSGTEGEYRYNSSSLYEFYTQKDKQGSFIRLGFFTPDNDTGNVQTSGSGYDSVVGAMWGTSDALLKSTDSVSALPVYVTGRNQSVAEVWRDGRLIHTQQLQAGLQALDTRQLPGGIYDITIKIIENGKTVDTQQAQVYKTQGWSNPDRRWRMNLWTGQRRTLFTGLGQVRDNTPFAAGGGIDILVHLRAILGVSGAVSEHERKVRMRTNITLSSEDTLFAQYTVGSNDLQSNQDSEVRYYHNFNGTGSASLFWRTTTTDLYGYNTRSRKKGDTWGSSMSMRLPWSTILTVSGQYLDTAWRRGFGADMSLNTQARLAGQDTSLRLSAWDRPGFNGGSRDHGLSLGVSVSLAPSSRHILSAETGLNQNEGYTGLNYQWQPEDNNGIRTAGVGMSYSARNTVMSANAAVDTPYMSGDGYLQHNTREKLSTAGGNLSQVLVMGGGKVASANVNRGSMESALIVDVESDDKNVKLQASGNMAETALTTGRNVIPAELWNKDSLQFTATGGESIQVFPPRESIQMVKGSVKYVKVKAVKTLTLVGTLMDENGTILKNRYVSSDVSGGVINAEGILTVDSGLTNRKLTVRSEGGGAPLKCELPDNMDKNKTVQFIRSVKCRTATNGEPE